MKKSFSTLYPYLAWWCENHGYMEAGGNTDYGHSLLVLLDDAALAGKVEK